MKAREEYENIFCSKIFTAHGNIALILKVSIVSNRILVFSSFTSLRNIDLSRTNGKFSEDLLQRDSLSRGTFPTRREKYRTRPFSFAASSSPIDSFD